MTWEYGCCVGRVGSVGWLLGATASIGGGAVCCSMRRATEACSISYYCICSGAKQAVVESWMVAFAEAAACCVECSAALHTAALHAGGCKEVLLGQSH